MNDSKFRIGGKGILFLSVIACVLVFAASVAGAVLLAAAPDDGASMGENEYVIAVDDNITVYLGDAFKLSPHLVCEDGTIEQARFDYASTSEAVTVDKDGNVTAIAVPEKGEEATIEISERNTSTVASVAVNVVDKLDKVLGITFGDEQGNTVLVMSEHHLLFGDTYHLNVVSEPKNVNIADYCDIVVTDEDGEEVMPFELAFDGSKVGLTVLGVGKGSIAISIVNDDGETLYSDKIKFESTMANEALGQSILAASGMSLTSAEYTASLEKMELAQGIDGDISDLALFESLGTVVLGGESVVALDGQPADICYRVPETLYADYLADGDWQGLDGSIIPYAVDPSVERYAVLHGLNDGVDRDNISYIYLLPTVVLRTQAQYSGYLHTGWTTADGTPITQDEVYDAADENGIHLYVVWTPIEYTIHYNIADESGVVQETYSEIRDYDMVEQLKSLSDLGVNKTVEGKKFVGWKYATASQMPDIPSGTALDIGRPTQNGAVIDFYDAWVPIAATVEFDLAQGESLPDGTEDEMTVEYFTSYSLPVATKRGYTITAWKDANDNTYPIGEANRIVFFNDGDVVTLKPVWSENSYTVNFDPSGGAAQSGSSLGSFTTRYTQPFKLPYVQKDGGTDYYWYADVNNNGYMDADEPTFEKDEMPYAVVGEGSVTLRAVWASYTIHFDLNGGESMVGVPIDLPMPVGSVFALPGSNRTGYTLVGWVREDTKEEFGANATVSNVTAAEGETVTFIAKWRVNSYTVSFDSAGGTNYNSVKLDYTDTYSLPRPTKTGHTFLYWTLDGKPLGSTITRLSPGDGSTVKLVAAWEAIKYKVTLECGYAKIVLKDKATGAEYVNDALESEKSVSYSLPYGSQYSVTITYKHGDRESYMKIGQTTSHKNETGYDITIGTSAILIHAASWNGCVTAGTLVDMADGTQKKIEDVRAGDMVMTWNFFTGQKEAQPVIVHWNHGEKETEVIELKFSDGSTIKVVTDHGFFNVDRNEMVFISSDNYSEFLGEDFALDNGEGWSTVTLVDVSIYREFTGVYSLLTAYNGNVFMDGKLSMTSEAVKGLFTYFEMGENMMYDQAKMQADIEKYGLFEYEDWAEYVTEEEFYALNGQYFSIIVGKGYLDIEDIPYLIQSQLR